MESPLVYAGAMPHPTWFHDDRVRMLNTHPQLWNMAWLMFPGLDKLMTPSDGVLPPELEGAAHLIENMDVCTFKALSDPPDQFMDYWVEVDTGDVHMVEPISHLPYLDVMQARADQAMAVLYPQPAPNVVRVNFKARKRVGA